MPNAAQPLLADSPSEHDDIETPELLGREVREWAPYDNLDLFFTRLYRYWREKGFTVIVVTKTLSLLALAFTIAFSGFLLLFVDWSELNADCVIKDTCDVADKVISPPWRHGTALGNAVKITFLAIFSVYCLWVAAAFALDLRQLREIWNFCKNKLGVSERQLATMTWPELIHRVVLLQSTTRLSIRRDLTEHSIVSRIMRKENYLIGMLNKGVLGVHIPLAALGRRPLLTTSILWNLHWVLLDPMFDDRFYVHSAYLHSGALLARRCRVLAAVNLVLSPFLLGFATIQYFLSNAERFYHHPSSIGLRRWSLLAQWKMREFGELPHFVEHRLNSASEAATKYCAQFPSPLTAAIATFVAYVAAALAGVLIFVMLLNDMLVERRFFGHTFVWWGASLGIVLALARAVTGDERAAYDPEAAMMEVVRFTHWMPRHWRGRAHTREVQEEFQSLFQYQLVLWLEEVVSILLMPYILYVTLPASADDIAAFLREFTTFEEGVGNVCSLATFDLQRHGNARYGAPGGATKRMQTRQGKLEKSLVSFATTYPTWQPYPAASRFLTSLHTCPEDEDPSAVLVPRAAQHYSERFDDDHPPPWSPVRSRRNAAFAQSTSCEMGLLGRSQASGSRASGNWAWCSADGAGAAACDPLSGLSASQDHAAGGDAARTPSTPTAVDVHGAAVESEAPQPSSSGGALRPRLHVEMALQEGAEAAGGGCLRETDAAEWGGRPTAASADAWPADAWPVSFASTSASSAGFAGPGGQTPGSSIAQLASGGVAQNSHSAPDRARASPGGEAFVANAAPGSRLGHSGTGLASTAARAGPRSAPPLWSSAGADLRSSTAAAAAAARPPTAGVARLAQSVAVGAGAAAAHNAVRGKLRQPLGRSDIIALSMAHRGSGIFGGAEDRVAAAHALLQRSYEARQPEHVQFRLAASSCSWLHTPGLGAGVL